MFFVYYTAILLLAYAPASIRQSRTYAKRAYGGAEHTHQRIYGKAEHTRQRTYGEAEHTHQRTYGKAEHTHSEHTAEPSIRTSENTAEPNTRRSRTAHNDRGKQTPVYPTPIARYPFSGRERRGERERENAPRPPACARVSGVCVETPVQDNGTICAIVFLTLLRSAFFY